MSTKIIGERIKKARYEANLSQRELSKALVVSEKAVSSYESGRTTPSINTLNQIAKETNKPITYFTSDSNNQMDIMSKLLEIEKSLSDVKKLLIDSTKPI